MLDFKSYLEILCVCPHFTMLFPDLFENALFKATAKKIIQRVSKEEECASLLVDIADHFALLLLKNFNVK